MTLLLLLMLLLRLGGVNASKRSDR